jgi:hypothetical protein
MKNLITMYELQTLVERCFDELEGNEFISKLETTEAGPGQKVIVNRQEVINHIANTIIGELHELEMIRRFAPMFREINRLAKDFEMLDEKEQLRANLSGLRIAPAVVPPEDQ